MVGKIKTLGYLCLNYCNSLSLLEENFETHLRKLLLKIRTRISRIAQGKTE